MALQQIKNETQSDNNQEHPAYIVVEGPIGVGKTTLANKLAYRVLDILEEKSSSEQ